MVRLENTSQRYGFQKHKICTEKGIKLIDASKIARVYTHFHNSMFGRSILPQQSLKQETAKRLYEKSKG